MNDHTATPAPITTTTSPTTTTDPAASRYAELLASPFPLGRL